jgi:hypothetical protein
MRINGSSMKLEFLESHAVGHDQRRELFLERGRQHLVNSAFDIQNPRGHSSLM